MHWPLRPLRPAIETLQSAPGLIQARMPPTGPHTGCTSAARLPAAPEPQRKVRILMKKLSLALAAAAAAAALAMPLAAQAQNIAVVNGKAVPKARFDTLMNQVVTQGKQQRSPQLEQQVRDAVVLNEIFLQEAEKRGLAGSADYRAQIEMARQQLLIRELFSDYQKKNPIKDADIQAEYDKVKSQNSGKEYRARHILVEKEEDAKGIITQIKGGAKFEDLAKKSSKDPGSAQNGGDLDWAQPTSYVPEFAQALQKLEKGQMTEAPVKTQFGYHIIKLEDLREPQFPPLDQVKPQIEQRLQQQKLAAYRDELRSKAKTDYKFGGN
jgi:peptidyl-prolyl cis-trans isomerase C